MQTANDDRLWDKRCHHGEGVISVFFYQGGKVAPVTEEKNVGARQIRHVLDGQSCLPTFGLENQPAGCKPHITTCSIIPMQPQGLNVRHGINIDKITRSLNVKFFKVFVHLSTLHLQTINPADVTNIEMEEKAYKQYIVSAVCTTKIKPLQCGNINLGISITPPCATHVAISCIVCNDRPVVVSAPQRFCPPM